MCKRLFGGDVKPFQIEQVYGKILPSWALNSTSMVDSVRKAKMGALWLEIVGMHEKGVTREMTVTDNVSGCETTPFGTVDARGLCPRPRNCIRGPARKPRAGQYRS